MILLDVLCFGQTTTKDSTWKKKAHALPISLVFLSKLAVRRGSLPRFSRACGFFSQVIILLFSVTEIRPRASSLENKGRAAAFGAGGDSEPPIK
ncbi:hypothetical protein [Albibacillus kandeliae]|uniref:hypothetical protein n=1 Tax=Albibacillus kandeliae TaxID=2174228 RepID=UPI0013009E8D|nr:hypothetical protein [Albibacillus kandeliae]